MLNVDAYLRYSDGVQPVEHLTKGIKNTVAGAIDHLDVKFGRYVNEEEFKQGINIVFTRKATRVIYSVCVRIDFLDRDSDVRDYLVEIDENTDRDPFIVACLLVRKDFGVSPINIHLVNEKALGELRKV